MSRETKRFWMAVFALVGTIIGVGIFGVPYAVSKLGVLPAIIFFVVLEGIQLMQQLFYAEAAMVCPDKMRLPGLVGRYVGKKQRRVVAVANVCGLWASLMAYIIVGGQFLFLLFGHSLGGQLYQYQMIWAAVGAFVVFFGLEFVSRMSFLTVSALIVALTLIFLRAMPSIRVTNFALVDIKDMLLPYGIIFFSLGGLPIIPEMEDILEGKHRLFRRSIIVGSLMAMVLTAAFGFIVYGVTGAATTDDAVTGLQTVLGDGIAALTAMAGFLAIMNCFFNIGTNLRNTFAYDYRLGRVSSWLLAMAVPFILYLIGPSSFVSVISFSSAVFGGITAVMVAWLYLVIRRQPIDERPLGVPRTLVYVEMVVLLSAAGLQLAKSVGLIGR